MGLWGNSGGFRRTRGIVLSKMIKAISKLTQPCPISNFWLEVAEVTFQVFLKWYLECCLSKIT
jgi:hypothetical protein